MLKPLQKDPSVQLMSAKGAGMFLGHFRLNHLEKPFDDPAIRRVVNMAVDQSKFMAALGVPSEFSVNNCLAYFTCGSTYSTNAGAETIEPRTIAAAKAALAKTKYKGEKITILQATDIEAPRVSAEVLAQTLRDVGFNVDLQSMDWGTVVSKRVNKTGWHIFAVHALGYDMSNPLTNLYIGNNCNDFPGWSCDERMTKKLTEFRESSDLAKQKEIAADIQKLAYETTPSIVWGQFAQPAALSKELKGMVNSSIPIFWNVSK
jgi:peptide/nickel transport system substrate-binding protein